jgi:hypothetical protein
VVSSPGLVVPGDVDGLSASARQIDDLAVECRETAGRQTAHFRALEGWTGEGSDAWVASAERTARAAVGIGVTLGSAAAVLDYCRRSIGDLRQRSLLLAARARQAGLVIEPDGTVWGRAGLAPYCHLVPGCTPAPMRRAGEPLLMAVDGRSLAGLAGPVDPADPWRAVQLEVAALVDDAETVYLTAVAGLRGIVEDYRRALPAPIVHGPRLPDGGGWALPLLDTAVAVAQLPAGREELRALLHRHASSGYDQTGRRPRRPGRGAALPPEAARMVRDRRLARAQRMRRTRKALDGLIDAIGRVPHVSRLASTPVAEFGYGGPLRRVPIANVILAGVSVQENVSQKGYSPGAAVAREATVALSGYAAAYATGAVIVVVAGGPPAVAVVVAAGVGFAVSYLAGWLIDKATGHDKPPAQRRPTEPAVRERRPAHAK